MKTVGVSPKVKVPAWVLFLAGVAVTAYGSIKSDDNLKYIGGTLMGSSGITFGFGYKAQPGVTVDHDLVEPELLDPQN